MIRVIRWILAAIAIALAGRWAWLAIRAGRCADCPEYGRDPETGLILRVSPLTAAERAASLELEAAAAAAVRV